MKKVLSALLICALLAGLTACAAAPAIPTESTPSPSTAQTAAPTVPGTQPATESTDPAWLSQVHSGLREDLTFNSGTLFIGDSLTYGLVVSFLQAYDLIGDARYMAKVGAPVSVFFNNSIRLTPGDSGCIYSPEFAGMSFHDAVSSVGQELTAIYLMLGTNYQATETSESYIQIVDYLLEECPYATVYLQLIPYSSTSRVDYRAVNECIQGAYDHYQAQGTYRVMLVDAFGFIGYNGLSGDGVHLNADGMDAWFTAICGHAIGNNIPE